MTLKMEAEFIQNVQQPMENAVFWDVTPRGFCKNPSFGGNFPLNNRRAGKVSSH
jgi:hypothetical protein